MKVAEFTLSACVVALAAFIGLQVRDLRRIPAAPALQATVDDAPGTVDSALASPSASSSGNSYQRPSVIERSVMGSEPALEPGELRRRLRQGGQGTYVDELLLTRDSSVARWPVRMTDPLRVWIDEPNALHDWSPEFPASVRDAFDTWTATGIPMRFTFIRDSASADVHIRFLPRFPSGISGKTLWSRNTGWWLVSGDIVLSLAHPGGGPVTALQMRAIALHEVGHLLGLDHTADPTNIMSARVRVRDLSDADRATIRLLYSVPAGSTRSFPDTSEH
ncbi:MAG: matrixin family metalloprotease [Gemmatimonadota bacterium]|nr:matrixin family metalloprotease [Gemmatimonadota bacterium]